MKDNPNDKTYLNFIAEIWLRVKGLDEETQAASYTNTLSKYDACKDDLSKIKEKLHAQPLQTSGHASLAITGHEQKPLIANFTNHKPETFLQPMT